MRITIGRAALVAGVLASLPSPGRADATPSASLELVWYDPGRALPSGAARCVRREALKQLENWGVRALWREGTVEGVERGSAVCVVILNRTTLGVMSSNVLGTASPPGDVGSTAWVLLPNVVSLLDRGRATGPTPTPYLARALARVALHEVIHLLAPLRGHARKGLMRASLRPADLLGPSIPLDTQSREALLEGVARREPRAADARGL